MSSSTRHFQTSTILQLIGQPDSGQTTLARLFVEAPLYQNSPILVVENTEKSKLANWYGITDTDETLFSWLEKGLSQQVTQDTRDWLLDECVIDLFPKNPEKLRDLLWVGMSTVEQLSPKAKDWLEYALPRLLQQYPLVVIDGNAMDLSNYYPKQITHKTVLIFKPERLSTEPIDEAWFNLEDADIILSQATTEDGLPQRVKDKVQAGQWRFVGRIPPQGNHDLQLLHEAFKDCFMRLNLPIALA